MCFSFLLLRRFVRRVQIVFRYFGGGRNFFFCNFPLSILFSLIKKTCLSAICGDTPWQSWHLGGRSRGIMSSRLAWVTQRHHLASKKEFHFLLLLYYYIMCSPLSLILKQHLYFSTVLESHRCYKDSTEDSTSSTMSILYYCLSLMINNFYAFYCLLCFN